MIRRFCEPNERERRRRRRPRPTPRDWPRKRPRPRRRPQAASTRATFKNGPYAAFDADGVPTQNDKGELPKSQFGQSRRRVGAAEGKRSRRPTPSAIGGLGATLAPSFGAAASSSLVPATRRRRVSLKRPLYVVLVEGGRERHSSGRRVPGPHGSARAPELQPLL